VLGSNILFSALLSGGTKRHGWFRHCATIGRSRILLPLMLLEFFSAKILPAALWPWDRLILLTEINISLGVGGGKGLRVPIVSKSGSLKLLASSESAQGLLYIFYLTFKVVDIVTSVHQSKGRRPLSVGILMLLILSHPIMKTAYIIRVGLFITAKCLVSDKTIHLQGRTFTKKFI